MSQTIWQLLYGKAESKAGIPFGFPFGFLFGFHLGFRFQVVLIQTRIPFRIRVWTPLRTQF